MKPTLRILIAAALLAACAGQLYHTRDGRTPVAEPVDAPAVVADPYAPYEPDSGVAPPINVSDQGAATPEMAGPHLSLNEAPASVSAPAPAVWYTDFDEAVRLADGLPVIVYLMYDRCGPCRLLKQQVLDTPEFREAVAGRAVLCEVDIRKTRGASERFGHRGAPYLIITRGGQPDGPTARGRQPLPAILDWLDRWLDKEC